MKNLKIKNKKGKVVAQLVYEENGETIHLYYNNKEIDKPRLLLSRFDK